MTQPYIGEIRFFGFNFPPRGWASAAGQLLSIAQNQALFALLGTTYGGNGVTTFALPDLRSRVPVGQGNNGGVGTYVMGQKDGFENVTLLQTQIPLHNHFLVGTTMTATHRPPIGRTLGADTSDTIDFYAPGGTPVTLDPASIATAGSTQPHNNIQPYTTLNASIALQGLFPSRN
ncbi:MAG: tail fiber protein [Sphingomonas sp.]|jgi:microcystin-dependent protein|uniref:phage tail protein n=1 Tax=Sphingomonas sp. TaxID=28214 RepID=UPI003564DD58